MSDSHARMLAALKALQRLTAPTTFQKQRAANLHRAIQIAAYPRSNAKKKI